MQIDTDGITVWVNGDLGECIGRFGRNGIDIHTTMAMQMDTQCLFCTHTPVTRADWELFQEKMLELHGVKVEEKHCPVRFRAKKSCPSGL